MEDHSLQELLHIEPEGIKVEIEEKGLISIEETQVTINTRKRHTNGGEKLDS